MRDWKRCERSKASRFLVISDWLLVFYSMKDYGLRYIISYGNFYVTKVYICEVVCYLYGEKAEGCGFGYY